MTHLVIITATRIHL